MISISRLYVSAALLLALLLLSISGCALIANVPTPTPPPTIAPSPTPPRLPTAAPTPTLPPPTAAPVSTTSEFDFADLSPYHQAMLPQFARDVDTIAAAGASRYYLQVELEPSKSKSAGPHLDGTARIRYTNTEDTPLSEIYFRLYPNLPGFDGHMTVESVMVDGQPVQTELQAKDSALRVPLAHPLAPRAIADISLVYGADVPLDTRQGYNIFSASEDTLALAGFYPTIAVYDETGWNIEIPPPYGDATYLDTSLYRVELTVPEDMVVAASGSVLDSTANSDGTKTLSLVSGPMRDFYIAARTDFAVVSETLAGIVVNSYYPPGLEEGGKLALRYAVDSLRVYSQDFGPYPYAEFDVVATPTTAGGVEYPGIVVVAQSLYDEAGGYFQFAAAHEVVHQWWYGMVGNDQVDNPWLDESLTNYSAVLYWEAIEGPESSKEFINRVFFGPYEYIKGQGKDRAVIGPVADFSAGEYGAIVYGKGPLFFDALRREVGDEVYLKIMQTYFAEYKYKIAQPENLFEVIERVSGQNVEPLIETWLENKS